jgi:hypothetical protein
MSCVRQSSELSEICALQYTLLLHENYRAASDVSITAVVPYHNDATTDTKIVHMFALQLCVYIFHMLLTSV